MSYQMLHDACLEFSRFEIFKISMNQSGGEMDFFLPRMIVSRAWCPVSEFFPFFIIADEVKQVKMISEDRVRSSSIVLLQNFQLLLHTSNLHTSHLILVLLALHII